MAIKKYLYVSDPDSQAFIDLLDRKIAGNVTSATGNRDTFYQIEIDESDLADLSEYLESIGFAFSNEVTGVDVTSVNTFANIPLNIDVPEGFNFFATDTGKIYINNSGNWTLFSTQTGTLIGGISGIGTNSVDTCSYGHNNANESPTMQADGQLTGLSISLNSALTGGICKAQVTINGVAQTGTGEEIELTNTEQYGFTVFPSPIAYSAGDRVGMQTITTSASPSGADATLTTRFEDT